MSDKASFSLQLANKFSKEAKKASTSMTLLSKSSGTAQRSLGLFSRSSGEAERAAGSASRATESFLGGMVKFELLKAAGRAVLGVGQAMFESAAFTDQMTLAFDQLTHGHGAETLDHTRRMAEMLGLEVHGTAKAYKNFLALQFKPAMADKLLLMGGDMQALGASAEEVQGIFTALGQIKSKGRLQGEELLQLQERGISGELVKQELVKQLGLKDIAEVDKLQQAGKIGADDFFVAFEKAINRKLGQSAVGDTGKKFAETTLSGMAGVFKAKATNLWDAIVDGGAKSSLLDTLKTVGDRFDAFVMSPDGQKAIQMLGGVVSGVASALGFAVPLAIDLFGAFAGGASDSMGAMTELFGVKGDGGMLGMLSQSLPPLARLFGTLFGGVVMVLGAVSYASMMVYHAFGILALGAQEMGSDIVAGIGNIILWWDDFKARVAAFDLWGWATGIGKSIVQGFAQGIRDFASWPIDAMKSVVGRLLGNTDKELKINSPSKAFGWRGEMSGQGFTNEFLRSMEPANDVVPDFASSVTTPDFGNLGGGGRSGGSPTVNITINLNGAVTDPEETAETIGRAVREQVEDLFREYADEAAA